MIAKQKKSCAKVRWQEMFLNMYKDGVKENLIAKYANVSIELVKKWIGLQPA